MSESPTPSPLPTSGYAAWLSRDTAPEQKARLERIRAFLSQPKSSQYGTLLNDEAKFLLDQLDWMLNAAGAVIKLQQERLDGYENRLAAHAALVEALKQILDSTEGIPKEYADAAMAALAIAEPKL